MHASNTLCDVSEDLQNLRLRESVLEPRVHEIDQSSSAAEFHEQKDLISAAIELTGVAVHICHDVPVSFKLLHGLNFRPHASQMVLVRDSHPLEHSDFMFIIFSRYPGDIDMGKATFGKVFFYDDPLTTHLDLGPRQECTRRRIGSWRWLTVGGAAVWEGGGRVCHGGGEVGEGCGWVGRFTASSSWRLARLVKKIKSGVGMGIATTYLYWPRVWSR